MSEEYPIQEGGMMEPIRLSDSEMVVAGLRAMLEHYIGPHGYLDSSWVPVEIALLVLAVARRSHDDEVWFPRGHGATIQAIEQRVDESLTAAMRGVLR